ncbi:MAG: hypothetical protein J6A01_08990 [Proteobacteria bacterium]|nr:hypothetical protein [Pseudomonadota bacterium]
MKRCAVLCLCFGCISFNMMGCDDDGDSKEKSQSAVCTYEGMQCSSDATSLLKCENGIELTVMACPQGCANNACTAAVGCTYLGAKCSDDAKAVLSCINGIESSQPCEYGCQNGACKTQTEETDKCTYEGNKCSEDLTQVVQCDNGTETIVETCDNGCENGECKKTEVPPSCDYQGTQCNENMTAVVKCEDGEETIVEPCEKGCENGACKTDPVDPDQCDFKGLQCDNDINVVVECKNGTVTVVETCDDGCQNGKCIKGEVPAQCNFKGTRCNEAMDAVVKCEDGEETIVDTCDYLCENAKCIDPDPTVCDFTGKQCRDNEVVKCDKDQHFVVVEECIEGCTNGACDKVACPASVNPSCFDAKTILECDAATKQMKKTACKDNKLCVNGECFEDSELVSCNFESSCTADNTAIRKCDNGKASYEVCPNKTSCSDDSGTPECVSTVTGTKCDEVTFNPYCDDNNHAFTCDEGNLKDQNCGTAKKCLNGECVSQKDWEIGDECTIENFPETCVGNVPVKCIKEAGKKAKVTATDDDCSQSGMICGVILEDLVAGAYCFEPCTVLGQERNTCTNGGGATYQSVYECIKVDHGLGDGRLGYDMEPGTLQTCDIGCKEGKCFDYTEGITGLGEPCEKEKFNGYCHNNVAVACELNDDTDEVQAELCDYDEACVVQKDGSVTTADCFKQCTKGTKPQYICTEGNLFGTTIYESQAYTCTEYEGVYVYLPDESTYAFCGSKGCDSEGKCLE